MKPLSEKQVDQILVPFARIFKKDDIKYLTKAAYQFIMLSSGFIAHYNIHGFRDVYAEVDDLAYDIIKNESNNRWLNFRKGDENYDYYRQKAEIYEHLSSMAHAYKINRFGSTNS